MQGPWLGHHTDEQHAYGEMWWINWLLNCAEEPADTMDWGSALQSWLFASTPHEGVEDRIRSIDAAGTATWSFRILYMKTSLCTCWCSSSGSSCSRWLSRVGRRDPSSCGMLYSLQLFGVKLGMSIPYYRHIFHSGAYEGDVCASFLQSTGAPLRLRLMNSSFRAALAVT